MSNRRYGMDFYDDKKNVEAYIQMCEDVNNDWVITKIQDYLDVGSSLLELGLGTGKDLDCLKELYEVLGTDRSLLFLDRYRKNHPQVRVMQLDAVSLDVEEDFDCIYSNKVLQHLTLEQLKSSIQKQSKRLNQKGIIFHTFWYGEGEEVIENLLFRYYNEDSLREMFESLFDIVHMERYTEVETMDSILIVARIS